MTQHDSERSGGITAPIAAGAGAGIGPAVALADAVRQFQTSLLRYAAQILSDRPDQAQDVVQDTFLRLRRMLLNGHTITNLPGWLHRVAHNLAVDLNRRENRICELDENMLDTAVNPSVPTMSSPNPATALERKEARSLAWRELQNMPDDIKQLLLLKLLQGLTLREISETTGLNIGTIHYRLKHGLRTLTQRVKAQGGLG